MSEETDNLDEAVWDEAPQVAKPIYKVDERPGTWWECLLFGWQHTLVDISPFVLPLAIAGALGMSAADSAQLINNCLVAMGVATLIQTSIGNRLPIIQGPSATLIGTLVPIAGQLGAPAMWGGIFVGGLVEMAVGASGVLRLLRRLFPIAVSGVVVLSIAVALGQLAVRLSIGSGRGLDFVFAGSVIALIFVLQIASRGVLGGLLSRGAVFLSIWLVGLGVAGVLGEVDWSLVASKPWLAWPRFFPYGGPGFGWELSMAAVLVILVGYFGSMVESLGDYAATCAAAGETYRVRHINRGIFAEGLGSAVASIFGGLPCTSYTQNNGIIATTRVASRFVVQVAAGVLILYGLCPKFGALLAAMPRSVLGGVFVIVCGMIAISGIRLISAAPATTANSLVVGPTLIAAIAVPAYVKSSLGEEWLDQLPTLVSLLMTNTVVLAVVLGVGLNFVLNLVLPGDAGSE